MQPSHSLISLEVPSRDKETPGRNPIHKEKRISPQPFPLIQPRRRLLLITPLDKTKIAGCTLPLKLKPEQDVRTLRQGRTVGQQGTKQVPREDDGANEEQARGQQPAAQ